MDTAKKLTKLRKEKGLSQEEVAKLIGVGRTTYLKYENGENRPVRKLKELSRLFGVSYDFLLNNDLPQSEVHEPPAAYGTERNLDALLSRSGYLTYSDKPLNDKQLRTLREIVRAYIKEESNNEEAPTNSYRNGKNIRKQ